MSNSSTSILDPIPPYFGGTPGEDLRLATVEEWKANQSDYFQVLSAIMETEKFQTAAKYCATAIQRYNEFSATVLYLEQQNPPEWNYVEFWEGGASVVDGSYDLASMFLYYDNFTYPGESVTCLADCYTASNGGKGCGSIAVWSQNVGKVSYENYCSMQWNLIDLAFDELKICGAQAIAGGPNYTRSEIVGIFELNLMEQSSCHYDVCQLDNPTEVCPTDKEALRDLYESYSERARIDGKVCGYEPPADGLGGGAIAGIVIGCLVFAAIVHQLIFVYIMKLQRERYKKRFVQTVARNISIAPNPGALDAETLAEEFKRIDTHEDGTISKAEMKAYLNKGQLGEILDVDFEALWSAMDTDNSGDVDAIEFIVFLSGCGDAFDSVYKEQKSMSKEERISYASKRFSLMNHQQ